MTALPAQFRDVLATLPSVAHLAALTLRDASGASVASGRKRCMKL